MTDEVSMQDRILRSIDCGIKRRAREWVDVPPVNIVPEDWDELMCEYEPQTVADQLWFARTLDQISVLELLSGDLRGQDNTRDQAFEIYIDLLDGEHVLDPEEYR